MIKNLSSEEKDMLINEMYPILKLVNETVLSIEDFRMFVEFCTVTHLYGEDLKKVLISVNPHMANYNDNWSISIDEFREYLCNSIRRQRLAIEKTMI